MLSLSLLEPLLLRHCQGKLIRQGKTPSNSRPNRPPITPGPPYWSGRRLRADESWPARPRAERRADVPQKLRAREGGLGCRNCDSLLARLFLEGADGTSGKTVCRRNPAETGPWLQRTSLSSTRRLGLLREVQCSNGALSAWFSPRTAFPGVPSAPSKNSRVHLQSLKHPPPRPS